MKNELRSTFIFILFATLGLFVMSAAGQGIGDRNRAADSNGGNYSIQGRVLLPDGKPATGVKVYVSSSDGPGLSVTTNIDGTFQTGSINAGNYTIAVKVQGYPSESEFLTIDRDTPAGRTFNVLLYLRVEGQKKGDFYSVNPMFKDVPKPAIEKFKQGVEKLQKNDAKAAVRSFDEAIAAYPNFAVAYHEKGSALLMQNELDLALEAFVKAVQIKPDYLEAKYSVGYTQYLKKHYEVAAAVFDDVVKQKKAMCEAYMYLGISLYNLRNIDAAESGLKTAIACPAGEKLALAHLYLGQIYAQKKKNSEAISELEKYLELLPKAPNADRIKTAIADLKKGS
ncbi:MAG: tetratricopeptide repeat protein [Chloracidobacterium sp.]|nr:tetratricopeptide repeat protein [Chloracidobacterium sp.]